VAGEDQRDGLLLHRGSLGIAHLMDRGHDVLAEAKLFESSHILLQLLKRICVAEFYEADTNL
jgi:hypothetical protein